MDETAPVRPGPPATNGVWLLTSRGRPEQCARVVEACRKTGMESPLVLYVDGSAYGYDKCWGYISEFRVKLEGGGLADSLQWCLQQFPNASSYGWLADDTYPRTRRWDTALELSAGAWWVSYAHDGWLADDDIAGEAVELGATLTSGLCWGGDLIRAAENWAIPPGVMQAGIDLAWCAVIKALPGLHRYRPDVLVEHWNWRTGKRELDATDSWVRDGRDYVQDDVDMTQEWIRKGGASDLATKIRRRMLEQDPAASAALDQFEVDLERDRRLRAIGAL